MTHNLKTAQRLSLRRSIKIGTQKSRAWAVATPLWTAFSRPTPRAPGVATAHVVQETFWLRRRQNPKQTTQQL